MKVRVILKSLLFAYCINRSGITAFGLVLFAFDLGETAVDAGIIIIYVLACFMGALWPAKLCVKTNICGVLSQVWLTMYYC